MVTQLIIFLSVVLASSFFLFLLVFLPFSPSIRANSREGDHTLETPCTQNQTNAMAETQENNNNNYNYNYNTTFEISTKGRKHVKFNDTEEAQWQGAFTFIQAADTQLGLQERYVEGKPNPGWSKEIKWTKEMVKDINSMEPKPKFLVICGDLIDAYPYSEQEEVRDLQERDLKEILRDLQVPLVCVCGNHDVGDTPTKEYVEKYKKSFGDDYFSFWAGGVYFLVVNSQFWQDGSLVPGLAREQDEWLERELREIRDKNPRHVIIFQHIPPFVETPDEPQKYFNLEPQVRKRLLGKFKEAGIRYVFCGHYHRNAGGRDGQLEVIVTSAVGAQLGQDTNGYRVVSVYEDRLEHVYYGLGEVSSSSSSSSSQGGCVYG